MARGRLTFVLRNPYGSPALLEISSIDTMNPYGQQWQQGGATPSIFGALPSLPPTGNSSSMQAGTVTFTFTNFKTTILNSTVFGPNQRTMYRVVTEPAQPPVTIIKDNESKTVALVHWQPAATVEIRGAANKQRVRDWLRLARDQRQAVSYSSLC